MEGWREQAACRGEDSKLFFPERFESSMPARRICATCPSKAPCLADALEREDRWGILGGLSWPERKRLRLEGQEAA